MSIFEFFNSVIRLFNSCSVEYLLIGGHAVNFHGYVRATMDMDIWISQSPENVLKFRNVLHKLYYDDENINQAINELNIKGILHIIRNGFTMDILGKELIRLEFDEVYQRREKVEIEGMEISIIGIDDLIKYKLKSNRTKNLLDAKELQEIRKQANNF